MSSHHPRAQFRLTDLELRRAYPERASHFDAFDAQALSMNAGPLGQAVRDAADFEHDAEIFRRFCLRGWLPMLLAQLRGAP